MVYGTNEQGSTNRDRSGVTLIDPRAARFGQTITMTILLLGVGLQEPLLIVAVAVILGTSVLSGWRVDLYRVIWQRAMIPVVGPPEDPEPAAPHRFAKLMGASMSSVAAIFLLGAPVIGLLELALFGYGVALLHAAAAAIGGIGNYCIGCRMYKQVAFFRRSGVV